MRAFRWVNNIFYLSLKEARSLTSDVSLVSLIIFCFTIGIVSPTKGWRVEVVNAPVAIIDYDHSQLSNKLKDAIMPSLFKNPILMNNKSGYQALMDGQVIFLIEIPQNFEVNVLANRHPDVQVLADATAMTQAGIGSSYIEEIFLRTTNDFLKINGIEKIIPFRIAQRYIYNQNTDPTWYISTMQIITNATVLSMIIVGAAFIREKERGTLEHLLVMPVSLFEIVFSKIFSNSLIILIASVFSFYFVAHIGLNVPLSDSFLLYSAILFIYLFSSASIGFLLATFAPSMPQFSLLAVPVYTITYLLSGAATPVNSMPYLMQYLGKILPMTQFVMITKIILLQGGGIINIVYQISVILIAISILTSCALFRFRSMISRQL